MAESMVDSVERIVIHALADMHASVSRSPANEPDSGVVTRDIINAIADEVQLQLLYPEGKAFAGWLRAQVTVEAKDGS